MIRRQLNNAHSVHIMMPIGKDSGLRGMSDILEFSAYLRDMPTIQSAVKTLDSPSITGEGSVLVTSIANAFNLAPAISYDRVTMFTGASPVSMQLDTTLRYSGGGNGDYDREIITPFRSILQMCMPREGILLGEFPLYKAAKDWTFRAHDAAGTGIDNAMQSASTWAGDMLGQEHEKGLGKVIEAAGGVSSVIGRITRALLDSAFRVMDTATLVVIPESYKYGQHLTVFFGNSKGSDSNILFDNMIIDQISYKLGDLLLDGNRPTSIDISLSLSTVRTQGSYQMMMPFRQYRDENRAQPNDMLSDISDKLTPSINESLKDYKSEPY